jgi:hypothetical protein
VDLYTHARRGAPVAAHLSRDELARLVGVHAVDFNQ